MKNLLTLLVISLLLLPCSLRAQIYQFPNGDFESWDGTDSDAEPTGWNGFPSAECTLASLICNQATATRHSKSSDTHNGTGYSCRIYATSVIGIVANGNLTTGRIHVGSTSAANSSNYNVTYTNQNGHNQPFNGTPDSIRFWAKVNASNANTLARMNTLIHEAADVRDPIISSDHASIVAVATLNFPGNNSWRQYSVPFDYDTYSGTTPAYILTTFSTNQTPGGGAGGDEVFIDDIEMVYIATLSAIQNDETALANFNSNTLVYNVELAHGATMPTVTATATSQHATVSITQPTTANPTATIIVTQGPESMTYTIHYTFATEMDAALNDLQVNGVTLPDFDPMTTAYELVLCDTNAPIVSATSRSNNAILNITQPTTLNPVATIVVTDRDSSRTYTIRFELLTPSTNLSTLRLDGEEISDFQPDITEHTIPIGSLVEIPILSAEAEVSCAEIALTQATATNLVATAVVTCNDETKTYTVTFSFSEGIANSVRQQFMVSPNPATDRLQIRLTDGAEATNAQITNTLGLVVKNCPLNGKTFELNINDLPKGLYFLEVRSGNRTLGIQKIVKQ